MTRPTQTVTTTTARPAPRSIWPRLLGGLIGAFVLLQLVPYGRAHANPPAQTEPQWDSPQTKTLFDRACADCHSNRTVWPWYSNVAPVSWFVYQHVEEGRGKFNINVPGFGEDSKNAASEVRGGGMPLPSYLPMHPTAKLTDAETQQLIAGLAKTFGDEGGEGEGGEKDGD